MAKSSPHPHPPTSGLYIYFRKGLRAQHIYEGQGLGQDSVAMLRRKKTTERLQFVFVFFTDFLLRSENNSLFVETYGGDHRNSFQLLVNRFR